MGSKSEFIDVMNRSYFSDSEQLVLGAAIYDGQALSQAAIGIPLKTLNRHGLIAGATGTGKTKTIQSIAGSLSKKGVPVLLMDIKGDLSGIAKPGITNEKIEERHKKIGLSFEPCGHPIEFLSLSNEPGVRLRATVSEFGPILFSKMLGLNETQTGIIALIFKYCDDNKLPLLDLKDIKKTLSYLTNEEKETLDRDYGYVSKSSVGAIMRKILELEQQGAQQFFGEKSFEVDDLIHTNEQSEGVISIIRLTDIQDKPKLFSTFMMALLGEIYSTFSEEGDLEKPKLVIFIDEAHLIFEEATKELLKELEVIVKLIRSKGVGLVFCTQNPSDIPSDILGQLGLKVQHSLRAFTAADRKKIKIIAENYPLTEYYKTDKLITQLGIGEAFVTALSKKGIPTPLVATLLSAPDSRMDVLAPEEISQICQKSKLIAKYNQEIDSKSAYELLNEKLEAFNQKDEQKRLKKVHVRKSSLKEIMDHTLTKQIGRTVFREITRGILGVLGLGGHSRSKY